MINLFRTYILAAWYGVVSGETAWRIIREDALCAFGLAQR